MHVDSRSNSWHRQDWAIFTAMLAVMLRLAAPTPPACAMPAACVMLPLPKNMQILDDCVRYRTELTVCSPQHVTQREAHKLLAGRGR